MVNVADTTISFKVEDELREKAQNLIKASGMTAKEWFQKAIATAELQSVKEGATDYASDLSEMEVHTTRIFELVSNMVQKSIYLRDKSVRDLETLLEQQREITANFQSKLHEMTEQKEQASVELEESRKVQVDLEKQLKELREILETNKLLISEYKVKNDTLTGLVAKYESYAKENEQLKETLANERSSHQLQLADLGRQNDEKASIIKELEQQTDRLIETHKTALERFEERKDVEQEKVLLALERDHQKVLTNANNEYSNKLKEFYESIDKQRQSFEQKIEEFQRQLSEERAKNYKSK
jgi:chromosome segregation ATPase